MADQTQGGDQIPELEEVHSQIAYLNGLADGLDTQENGREGRILTGMLDALEGLVQIQRRLTAAVGDLDDYLQEVDQSLWEVEEDIYGRSVHESVESPSAGEEMDEVWEFDCPTCGEALVLDETEPLQTGEVVEVSCPTCGEIVWHRDPLEESEPAAEEHRL